MGALDYPGEESRGIRDICFGLERTMRNLLEVQNHWETYYFRFQSNDVFKNVFRVELVSMSACHQTLP